MISKQPLWLLKFMLSLTIALTVVCFMFYTGEDVWAQNKPPFEIQFAPDSTGTQIIFYENSTPAHGPYLEHISGNQTPNNWKVRGYFYEYIVDSRFNCNHDIINEFVALTNEDQRKKWIRNNKLEKEWEVQKQTFGTDQPKYFFKFGDNQWRGGVDKTFESRFLNDSAKLAYCLQVKRQNGKDAALNNIVFNVNNWGQSQTGIEVTDKLMAKTLTTPTNNTSSTPPSNSNDGIIPANTHILTNTNPPPTTDPDETYIIEPTTHYSNTPNATTQTDTNNNNIKNDSPQNKPQTAVQQKTNSNNQTNQNKEISNEAASAESQAKPENKKVEVKENQTINDKTQAVSDRPNTPDQKTSTTKWLVILTMLLIPIVGCSVALIITIKKEH